MNGPGKSRVRALVSVDFLVNQPAMAQAKTPPRMKGDDHRRRVAAAARRLREEADEGDRFAVMVWSADLRLVLDALGAD